MNKFDILSHYFGYQTFREGQEQLIDSIVSGRDVLGIMPTGAGKSICYQIPAMLFDGITLVVSPLISLMRDQVSSLVQSGIPAAFLNSSLNETQYRKALSNAMLGMYKIIYVAPERLFTDSMMRLASAMKISMVTVDEAHCVSHWGQDFRPSYLAISAFINALPYRPVVSAFTATATDKVREDIARLLELDKPDTVITGYDRKNLFFSVEEPSNKREALVKIIRKHYEESVIIYCSTRKTVEEVCDYLCARGYTASRYHAGLDPEERERSQQDFIHERCDIMVATNAFGMGIDKSNVRCVIHYNMPQDVESYYQEAGRAGRDGEESECVLLFGKQDIITAKFLIDNGYSDSENEIDEEEREKLKEIAHSRLQKMIFYCSDASCLRAYILSYFGEKDTVACGKCSRCLTEKRDVDITEDARKIFGCIYRTGERFGAYKITCILRGSQMSGQYNTDLSRFESMSEYGSMKDQSDREIRYLIDRLTSEGYIHTSLDEYKTLSLTGLVESLGYSDRIVLQMKDDYKTTPEEKAKSKTKKKELLQKIKSEAISQDEIPGLFDHLKRLRKSIADTTGVPSFVVFSDATLRDMSSKAPTTLDQFRHVFGVGDAKTEKYGTQFTTAIREFKGE